MRAILVLIIAAIIVSISPAAAGNRLDHQTPFTAKPRPVASFTLVERRVEMLAVTKRARADTRLRRAHMDESKVMAKVMPGYPQPAFVSVDLRVNF